jgi:hypothetical protein
MVTYDNDKERLLHAGAIHGLSRESGLPETEIGKIYEQELDKLKRMARVKDYLSVLTCRVVKESLRVRL